MIKNPNTHKYAAYGALTEEVVEVLLDAKPKSQEILVGGLELAVLSKDEIGNLYADADVPEGFRLYGVRPSKSEDSRVRLRIFELNKEQQTIIDAFNFGPNNLYLQFTMAMAHKGEPMQFLLDTVPNGFGTVVDGEKYEPYLNAKELTLGVARETRDKFYSHRREVEFYGGRGKEK